MWKNESLDRISFAIAEDSLNNRRLEIQLDASINDLIDNYLSMNTKLTHDSKRSRNIHIKLHQMKEEISTLDQKIEKVEEFSSGWNR